MEQATISQQFADKCFLELKEGNRVRTSEFLAKVNSVLSRIRQDYRYFERFIMESAIKFVCNDAHVTTMSIDDRNNVYVSVNYLVLSLNMDEELIYALFLIAYNTILSTSIDEEKKFLTDGMPSGSMVLQMFRPKERPAVQLTRPIHHDINIALDIKANSLVLRNDSITMNLLANKMNAVCVNSTDILTLSMYYYHERMSKWREDVNYIFPLTPSVRPRPDTFSSGYAYTMRYLNELIKVYDKEEALSLAANVTMRK